MPANLFGQNGDFTGAALLRTVQAQTKAERPRRYDQCDETCTVDCGHCKGAGRTVKTSQLKPGDRVIDPATGARRTVGVISQETNRIFVFFAYPHDREDPAQADPDFEWTRA